MSPLAAEREVSTSGNRESADAHALRPVAYTCATFAFGREY